MMQKNRNSILFFFCFFLLIGLQSKAHAFSDGFEALSFRPVTDKSNSFTVWDGSILAPREFHFGTSLVYAYRPLQLTQVGNARLQGVIDHSIVQHFYSSLGILERWLNVGIDLPVAWTLDYLNPNIAAPSREHKTALGDVRVNFKSQLYQSNDQRFALAFVPFISLPTGYGQYYMGNRNLAGGGYLAFDYRPLSNLSFAFNTGIEAMPQHTLRNLNKQVQLLLSASSALEVTKSVQLVAEVNSKANIERPYQRKVESPLDAKLGLKWKIKNTGLVANLGGGAGIIYGSEAPRFSVFTGLGYSFQLKEKKQHHREARKLRYQSKYESKKPVIEYSSRPKKQVKKYFVRQNKDLAYLNEAKIHFEFNKSTVTKGDEKKLQKIAQILQKTPSLYLTLQGHTDSTGPAAYNKILSEKRASYVKMSLRHLGIDSERMKVVGHGETMPLGDNKDKQGRAANRRVDFLWFKQEN